jgi:hypothetical protein
MTNRGKMVLLSMSGRSVRRREESGSVSPVTDKNGAKIRAVCDGSLSRDSRIQPRVLTLEPTASGAP